MALEGGVEINCEVCWADSGPYRKHPNREVCVSNLIVEIEGLKRKLTEAEAAVENSRELLVQLNPEALMRHEAEQLDQIEMLKAQCKALQEKHDRLENRLKGMEDAIRTFIESCRLDHRPEPRQGIGFGN